MRGTFVELRRELRWARSSRTLLVLLLCGVAITAWAAIAASSDARSLVAQFDATLDSYRQNGPSIDDALAAPADVDIAPDGSETIGNPLRYDFDAALLAVGRLSPAGLASDAGSVAALLFLPVLGFSLGVIVATHDHRNGSLSLRWARSTSRRIAIAKAIAVVILAGGTSVLIQITAGIGGLVLFAARDAITGGLPTAVAATPLAIDNVVVLALDFLAGASFGSLGLAAGSLLRGRTAVLSTFAVAYFLLPIAGTADPRNALALLGREILTFPGPFTATPVGNPSPAAGFVILAAWTLAAWGLVGFAWRARLPVRR